MKEWDLQKQYMFIKGISDLIQKGYDFQEACEFNMLYLSEKERIQVENGLTLLIQGQDIRDFFGYLNIHRDVQMCLSLHQQFKSLEECLFQGSELLRRRMELMNQIKQVIKYPIFLLCFLLVIIFVCNFVIFPQFISIFQSISNKGNTVWLIKIVKYIPVLFSVFLLLLITLFIYYRCIFSKKDLEYQYKILMNIPYIKNLLEIFYSYQFSNQLGGLLKNGIHMIDALEMMSKESYNVYFQSEITQITQQLQEGEEFIFVLEKRAWLRNDAKFVIQHGVRTGNIDKELYEYSQYLFKYAEQRFFLFLKYVQPITFILVAGMVVLIYSALMLPLFQMLKTM